MNFRICQGSYITPSVFFAPAGGLAAAGRDESATLSSRRPQTMDDDEDESFLYSGIEKESGGSNGAAQSTSPSLLQPSTR